MNGLMVALVAVASHGGWDGDQRLRFAAHDAARVKEVFVGLGGVRPERAVTLEDPGPADVEGALRRVRGWVEEARREGRASRVVLYYSGHADRRALHLGRAALDHEHLRRQVRQTGAEQRVLLVDACESGGIVAKGATAVPTFDLALGGDASRGEVVIASSTAGEASLESERLRGSFFTHHLVAGLRGAADGGDGVVSLTEAYEYAYRMTVADTGATRAGAQHPSFEIDLAGMGALVLTEPGRAAGVGWLRMPATTAPWMVLEHRHGPAVLSLPPQPGEGGRLLALRPGRYWLRRRAPDGLEVASVQVVAGRTVEVERLARSSVPYAQVVRKGLVDDPGLAHSLSASVSVGGAGLADTGALGGADLRWWMEAPGWAVGVVLGGHRAVGDGAWVELDHRELSLGLAAALTADLGASAVRFGPEARWIVQSQTFGEGRRAARDRTGHAVAYGVGLHWEIPLGGLWSAHVGATAEAARMRLAEEGPTHRLRARAGAGLTWSLP